MSLPSIILEQVRRLPVGAVLLPREFLHLGTRAAVDQAFSRLTKAGDLWRVSRGIYIGGTPVATDESTAEDVLKSVVAKGKAAIVSGGAKAARLLGFSNDCLYEDVFLTTGRNKTLCIGTTQIRLQHAPAWMMALGNSKAGDAIRAIAWLGRGKIEQVIRQVRQMLSAAEWKEILAVRGGLPCWMAAAVGQAGVTSALKGS